MHLPNYRLAPGYDARFVLLQARDAVEAIRLWANRLKGALVTEMPEVVARLKVKGQPDAVGFPNQ